MLGKLVVPPYRSDDGTPLAVENGNSCSYLTAGHHALVLHPTWEYGGTAYEATKMGGIVEQIAPTLHVDAADTLDDGPWEEAGASSLTGELYFLNGDRFLEVNYLTSTTDMNGAVGLSRTALGRLGSGEAKPAASAAGGKLRGGCPAVEQVGQAAGFPVTFTTSIGNTWSRCMYEMTGRYRGNFLELSRQPKRPGRRGVRRDAAGGQGHEGRGREARPDRPRQRGMGLRLQLEERGGGRSRLAGVPGQPQLHAGG